MGFKIIKPEEATRASLEPGRGESIKLVNVDLGTESVDVHINILLPKGPRGRVHRHSVSDNVYIVKSGEGELTIEGDTYHIVADDVVFIPAGTYHSLSNVSDEKLVIYEILFARRPPFDFVVRS